MKLDINFEDIIRAFRVEETNFMESHFYEMLFITCSSIGANTFEGGSVWKLPQES